MVSKVSNLVEELRRDWFVGAVAKCAFDEVMPPNQSNWRPIEKAPKDDRPIWSTNCAMEGKSVISKRGYQGHNDLWTVLAEPFDKYAGAPGFMHCPDRWQPLVYKEDDQS